MGMDTLSFFFINLFFANLLGDYSFAHLHGKQRMNKFRKRLQKREKFTFLTRGNESEHLWKHYTSSTENASRPLSRLTCMTVHSYFSFRDSKCHYFHHIKQAGECCFSVVLPNKVVEVN